VNIIQSPADDTRPAASGATGGPSTVHGIDYQLKVAVYEAYRMMAEVLAAPFRDLTITLEARSIHEEGITRWDVGLGLPTRLLEIKLNANRSDILEWLDGLRKPTTTRRNLVLFAGAPAARWRDQYYA
jgi:hypothetical protein